MTLHACVRQQLDAHGVRDVRLQSLRALCVKGCRAVNVYEGARGTCGARLHRVIGITLTYADSKRHYAGHNTLTVDVPA